MQRNKYTPHSAHVPGFTLVELMIAIAISAILMLGVVQVFVISRHSFHLDNGLANAQENARFAVHTMSEDIRMAGYIGCRAANVANTLNNQTNWMFDFDTPLQGWDGSATGTYPFPVEFASKVVAGTDAIVVLRGDNTQYQVVTSNNNAASITLNKTTGLSQWDVVMASDCNQASIFQITKPVNSNTLTHETGNGAPGNCTKGLGSPVPSPCTANGSNYNFGGTGSLMKMKATAYYIGQSTSGTGNSLYSMSMDKGAAALPVELAEGVENMQILYGYDSSGDGLANKYIRADQVSAQANGFKSVVSVRLSLLVDTTTDVLNAATTKIYTLFSPTLGATITHTDKKLRFPITTTIKLRNRGVM